MICFVTKVLNSTLALRYSRFTRLPLKISTFNLGLKRVCGSVLRLAFSSAGGCRPVGGGVGPG
jgi:hypothetical protein